jgi:hypothetical protein
VGATDSFFMRVSATKECRPPRHQKPNVSLVHMGVEVTLEARSDLVVPANPYYAVLVDDQSRVHEATLGGCSPALRARLLGTGQRAQGWLSFDVPSDALRFTLVYAPRVDGHTPEILFEAKR